MMSARPTAASAAATPIEKITNMIPVSASGCSLKRQNAMKFRFAALSISSMPMSTMMALRRVNAPARPMLKSMALKRRYAASGVMLRARKGAEGKRGRGESSFSPFLLFSLSCSQSSSLGFRSFVAHCNNHRPNQGGGKQQADDFQRQHKLCHQRIPDLFDGSHYFLLGFPLTDETVLDGPGERAKHSRRHQRTPNP